MLVLSRHKGESVTIDPERPIVVTLVEIYRRSAGLTIRPGFEDRRLAVGESITIDHPSGPILVMVKGMRGMTVQLGFQADRNVVILRSELTGRGADADRQAA